MIVVGSRQMVLLGMWRSVIPLRLLSIHTTNEQATPAELKLWRHKRKISSCSITNESIKTPAAVPCDVSTISYYLLCIARLTREPLTPVCIYTYRQIPVFPRIPAPTTTLTRFTPTQPVDGGISVRPHLIFDFYIQYDGIEGLRPHAHIISSLCS
jgi:hypothetical protein